MLRLIGYAMAHVCVDFRSDDLRFPAHSGRRILALPELLVKRGLNETRDAILDGILDDTKWILDIGISVELSR